MRKAPCTLLLAVVAASCSSSTESSPTTGVSTLETTVVSPVRNNVTWPRGFDPDPSASVTDGALTVVGYLPFDQCRFTTQSDSRILDGSVFVTLTSTQFPERTCVQHVAETRYAVSLTKLPTGAHQVFVIENPALRWADTNWVSSVDTLSVGSVTIP